MKEIQFRAKDLEGNWVYGYYFIDSFKHFIKSRKMGIVKINVETLGHYINLKDVNGEKIFTGDIMQMLEEARKEYISNNSLSTLPPSKEYFTGVIFYDNGSYCLKVGNCQYATEEYIYGFQVVGNITDNKEMLV